MKRLKNAVLRLTTALLLPASCVASFAAAAANSLSPPDEITKQQSIYQSRGDDVPEGYVVQRSLLTYLLTLPSAFTRTLAGLGPNDRWLDIGAGEGRAIMDYCTAKYDVMLMHGMERRGKKAKAVAISIEDRRTVNWYKTAASFDEASQIQYLAGRRLREYSLQELGQFDVITDMFGGFSYAQDLTLFMEKSLGFLKVNGDFYTVLQDVHTEKSANRPYYPDAPFLTELKNADGSELKVCSWLKSISCVEVSCEAKVNRSPPLEVYRIRKVCDKVTVPRLVPSHFEAGTPPERRFQSAGSTP